MKTAKSTRRMIRLSSSGLVLWGLIACGVSPAADYEQPRDLAAEDVVSGELRAGKGYRVGDVVRADGFAEHYVVKSDRFGSFDASSAYMLPVRIQEVRALESLSHIKRRDAFKDSVVDSAKSPFRVMKSLATEPKQTLKGAGAGAKKIASKATGWLGGDRRERSESEDSAFSEAIGYSKRKRRMAHALGVDAYSTNAKLQEELDRVSAASLTGGLTFSLTMAALPIPPVIDLARQATNFTAGLNGLIASKSGGDLYRMNREILLGMGISKSRSEPFLDNAHASPRHKTFITAALKDLKGVEGLEVVVDRGRDLGSPVAALRLQRTLELARGYHQNASPLRAVATADDALLFISESSAVLLLPADRLLWTRATDDLASTLSSVARERDLDGSEIWVPGAFSDDARDELRARGITLHERATEQLEGINTAGG